MPLWDTVPKYTLCQLSKVVGSGTGQPPDAVSQCGLQLRVAIVPMIIFSLYNGENIVDQPSPNGWDLQALFRNYQS